MSIIKTEKTNLAELVSNSGMSWLSEEILNQSGDVIFLHDLNGNILYANQNASSVLGYSYDELTSMNISDIDMRWSRKLITQGTTALETGDIVIDLGLHKMKNSSTMPVEICVRKIKLEDKDAIVVICRDISSRTDIETRLYESEAALRSVFYNATDHILIIKRDGLIVSMNHAGQGHDTSEVINTNIEEYLKTPNKYKMLSGIEKIFREGGQFSIDDYYEGPDGTKRWYHTNVTPVFNNNNVESVVMIARDITDRKSHEQKLELYNLAFDSSGEGILISGPTDAGNPIIYANQQFSEITGYSQSEVIGKNCRILQGTETDQKTVKSLRSAIRKNKPITCEILNYRKDGASFWNLLSISPVLDNQGKATHFVGFQQDITSQRHNRDALIKSEIAISRLYETSAKHKDDINKVIKQLLKIGSEYFDADIGMVTKLDGDSFFLENYYSTNGLKLVKGSKLLGRSLCKISLKNDSVLALRKISDLEGWNYKTLAGQKFNSYIGVPFEVNRQRVGTICFMTCKAKSEPFTKRDESLLRLVATWIGNEKERIEAKERVINNERRIMDITDAVPVMIAYVDTNENYVFCNDTYEEYLEIDRANILGRSVKSVVGAKPYKLIGPKLKTALSGEAVHLEVPLTIRNNSYHFSAAYTPDIDKKGAVKGIFVCVVDITSRKLAELKLEESEARWRSIIEYAEDFVLAIDKDFNILSLNKVGDDLDLPDVIGKNCFNLIKSDSNESLEKGIREVFKTAQPFTTEFLHHGNEETWFSGIATPIIQDGEVGLVTIILRNINSLKQVEEQLKEGEKKFRQLAQNMLDKVSIFSLEGEYLWVSDSCETLLGFKPNELIGTNGFELIHPEDIHILIEASQKITNVGPGKGVKSEYRIKHKNGHYIWFESLAIPLFDENGDLHQLQTSSRDITDRRLAEERLAASEAKWRSVFEHAEDLITTINKEGLITEINQLQPGYEMEDVIGTNMYDFLLDDDKVRISTGIKKVFEKGEPFHYELKIPNIEGGFSWFSSVASPVINEGRVEYVNIISRNITKIKESEASVMNAIVDGQDNERKRISRELHDGLGQLLSGIKLNVVSLESELVDGSISNSASLANIRKLITLAIDEVRTISHDLMPNLLEEFGLAPALEELAEKNSSANGLNIRFEGIDLKDRYSPQIEVNLYRIAQELLNNVVKHSGAGNVELQLIDHGNSLMLLLEDDGEGFKNTNDKRSGIGLKNVESRATLLGGEFGIDSGPKSGTLVTVEVPYNNMKDE